MKWFTKNLREYERDQEPRLEIGEVCELMTLELVYKTK
jgi:hypothetical protein